MHAQNQLFSIDIKDNFMYKIKGLKLIQETFPQLESHTWDPSYVVQRAILMPKNEDAQKINDIIIGQRGHTQLI